MELSKTPSCRGFSIGIYFRRFTSKTLIWSNSFVSYFSFKTIYRSCWRIRRGLNFALILLKNSCYYTFLLYTIVERNFFFSWACSISYLSPTSVFSPLNVFNLISDSLDITPAYFIDYRMRSVFLVAFWSTVCIDCLVCELLKFVNMSSNPSDFYSSKFNSSSFY